MNRRGMHVRAVLRRKQEVGRAFTARLVGAGTFTITGGSGAFAGVRGDGTCDRRGGMIGAHNANGTCLGRKTEPKASHVTVVLTGKAALAPA
jgi:hypothetical protein